jgi:hypothetical protein
VRRFRPPQRNVFIFFLGQQAEQSRALNPDDRGARKPSISLYVLITGKSIPIHSLPL